LLRATAGCAVMAPPRPARFITLSATVLMLAALILAHALADAATPPSGTLRFFNRDIVTFASANFGLSPAERADKGAQRVGEALAKGGPGTVTMVMVPEGLNVLIDDVYVFRILKGDLDAEDGQTFDQAEVIVGGRLREAIAAAQSSIRGRDLFRAATLSVA